MSIRWIASAYFRSVQRDPIWQRPLLLTIPALLALGWTSLSGYEGLNGQDAHDYLRIAVYWRHWASGGERPIMVEHPHGYPIAGALLGVPFNSTLLGLRTISLLAAFLLLFALRRTLLTTGTEGSAIDVYLLLAVGASPFVLRYTMMVMSDIPGMALLMMAFACSVRWNEDRTWALALSALLFAVLALAMRLAVAPMLVALVLALFHGARPGRWKRWSIAVLLFGVVLAAACFFVPVAEIEVIVARSPLGEWSPLNLFRRTLLSDDGVLHYRFPNVLYVLGLFVHPGILPIGVCLLPFFRWADLRATTARLAAFVLFGYLLFIAGMPFQNDRVLLMALPLVVVLLFPAFTRALAFVAHRGLSVRVLVAVVLVCQLGLFARAMWPQMMQARTERELAASVNALAPSHVYTHGMGAALVNYCSAVEVVELWYTELDTFHRSALVVVHPANLEAQWQGRPPFINWQRLQARGLDQVEDHPEGWTIQRVR